MGLSSMQSFYLLGVTPEMWEPPTGFSASGRQVTEARSGQQAF